MHGFSRHSAPRGQDRQHRRTDEDMKEKMMARAKSCFAFAVQRTEFPYDPIVKFCVFFVRNLAPVIDTRRYSQRDLC